MIEYIRFCLFYLFIKTKISFYLKKKKSIKKLVFYFLLETILILTVLEIIMYLVLR